MKARSVVTSAASLAFVVGSVSLGAQNIRDQGDGPIIRIYSQSGGAISRYITPVIEVRENAYAMVISVDLDRDIQVLYPAYPDDDGFLQPNERQRLPNFFAGNASSRMVMSDPLYGSYRYSTWGGSQPVVNDARGTVIAIASRTPLDFTSLSRRGDWNYAAIQQLVGSRGPNSVAIALARRLGATGNGVGYDVYRYAGGQTYYASAFPSCDLVYGDVFGIRYLQYAALNARIASSRNGSLRVVGYDQCGNPFVAFVPERPRVATIPVGTLPSPKDTAGVPFPEGRIPRGVPRPGRTPLAEDDAAVGAFPVTRLPRSEPVRGDSPPALPGRLSPRPVTPTQAAPEVPQIFPERRLPERPDPVVQPRNDDTPARLIPPRERLPDPVNRAEPVYRAPEPVYRAPEPVRRADPPPMPAPQPMPAPPPVRSAPESPRPEVREAPVVPPPGQ